VQVFNAAQLKEIQMATATQVDSGTFTQNGGSLVVSNTSIQSGDKVTVQIQAQNDSVTPYFSCGADNIAAGEFRSVVAKVGGGTVQNANLTMFYQVWR